MEVAINPRAITVSSILGQVRRGQIIRVHAIGDGCAEALEAEVLEGSVLVGQKLRDLDLPDGISLWGHGAGGRINYTTRRH